MQLSYMSYDAKLKVADNMTPTVKHTDCPETVLWINTMLLLLLLLIAGCVGDYQ
jgi:hypothetical protein